MSDNKPAPPHSLTDRFGRHISYLRISLTDRCNFRCVYCMSEQMTFVPREHMLTLEEIATVARAFTELGVKKIRLTGGEPLVRQNALWLIREIGALPGLSELAMTTNGAQLAEHAQALRAAGVRRLNISLDSLRAERFSAITRTGKLSQVLKGIEAARQAGFERLKLNSVILKHRNHDEINALVQFAVEREMDISFIEEMPLGMITEHDRAEAYYSSDAILEDIGSEFELLPTTENTGGPARYWRITGSRTRVGMISPHSHNFCDSCNRVRLTTEGRLLLCLGQEHSVDLRRILREQPGDEQALQQAIIGSMAIKPKGHEFDLQAKPIIFRHMNATGG
jgi:cyclic pyranopterin phosphate synthase